MHPLGNQTRTLGLLGWPVAHSVSPPMHNAAFKEAGLNCHYAAFAVPPNLVQQAVHGLAALGLVGANVTIPHKEAVIPHLDEIGPSARLVGAVNTIVVHADGRLVGHNTDGPGFMALLQDSGVDPAGRRCVVLGAGGASRAVATHLALAESSQVAVINRTVARAEEVVAQVAEAVGRDAPALLALSPHDSKTGTALRTADLIVNCTPLGMHPDVDSTPLPDLSILRDSCAVVDTIYHPQETRLLREAAERGLTAVGGLGMLVHQGALSWEYWFGRKGPAGAMMAAAGRALEAQG